MTSDLQALTATAHRWRSEMQAFLATEEWRQAVAGWVAKGMEFPSVRAAWSGRAPEEIARLLMDTAVDRLRQARTYAVTRDVVAKLVSLAREKIDLIPEPDSLLTNCGFAGVGWLGPASGELSNAVRVRAIR